MKFTPGVGDPDAQIALDSHGNCKSMQRELPQSKHSQWQSTPPDGDGEVLHTREGDKSMAAVPEVLSAAIMLRACRRGSTTGGCAASAGVCVADGHRAAAGAMRAG